MRQKPSSALRRGLLLGAAAGTAVALSAGPALATPVPSTASADAGTGAFRFQLPEPTGHYDIGKTELHLVDEDRADPWVEGVPRELMIDVRYPAKRGCAKDAAPYLRPGTAERIDQILPARLPGLEPGDVDFAGVTTHAYEGARPARRGGDRPVVLYSPGAGDPRAYGTVAAEELASRGYVVVTVDHTYEAPVEFPGGRVEEREVPGFDTETYRTVIDTRVRDIRFVLDRLAVLADGENPDAEGRELPHGLGRTLDLSSVGMFGHSAGGFTAAQAMLFDDRIDAGVNLDGSMAYHVGDEEWSEVTEQGLDRPFMLMGSGHASSGRRGNNHELAPDWARFWENSTGWRRDLYIGAGEHYSLTDSAVLLPQMAAETGLTAEIVEGSIGTVAPERLVAVQRNHLPAFFDRHLRGEPRELLEGPSPAYPGVEFID